MVVVIVSVCTAFGQTELVHVSDATAIFSVEAVDQVFEQARDSIYLAGGVGHDSDLFIKVNQRIRNA